jgi:hypothetical protein
VDLADQPVCVLRELRGAVCLRRVADVDQVVHDAGPFLAGWLGGADVHAAVHQRRVHADDLGVQLLGQGQRGSALAGSGGAGERHQGG